MKASAFFKSSYRVKGDNRIHGSQTVDALQGKCGSGGRTALTLPINQGIRIQILEMNR